MKIAQKIAGILFFILFIYLFFIFIIYFSLL